MKINPLATIGGIILISSLFLPWINSDSWWFRYDGSLKDMMAKTSNYIGTYNLGDFVRKECCQVVCIMLCFVFLFISGITSFFQFRWSVQAAAFLGFAGLLFYTAITLEFLMAVSFFAIGYGYYTAWIGVILIGLGSEFNNKIFS